MSAVSSSSWKRPPILAPGVEVISGDEMLLRSFVVMIRFLVLVRIRVLERLIRSLVFYREMHELGLNLEMLACRSAVLVLCSAVFQ